MLTTPIRYALIFNYIRDNDYSAVHGVSPEKGTLCLKEGHCYWIEGKEDNLYFNINVYKYEKSESQLLSEIL